MESAPYIVPERACGSCTACCTHLAILEDGMSKLPGVTCEHCVRGTGCAVYQARPQVCRSYNCLWRSLPNIDDDWRPDLSGVLMLPQEVPPGTNAAFGVNLVIIGSTGTVESERFAGMVAGFVESGTATWLDLPGGPGMLSHNSLLNDALAPAIAARSLPYVQAMLASCYNALKAVPPKPVDKAFMEPAPRSEVRH
jgi:hypothetical protein